MRFPVYSLKTGILAQLVFLIVAAMLLIHVVEVKFTERDLIEAKARTGRLFVRAVEESLANLPPERDVRKASTDPRFQGSVSRLLAESGFSSFLILDTQGQRICSAGAFGDGGEDGLIHAAREALDTGTPGTRLSGTVWGVIWISPKDMVLASPLALGDRPPCALAVRGSLASIYVTLRKTQKLVLLYILLDTLILTLVGVVLLSRIVVKPIHRLLRMTGEYKEGDTISIPAESSRNEIGELSRSLTVMLRRLEENKRELRDHIASLEKANRDLQQAQSSLVRSEKLASVGRLAAGIAHEIGNPIGITLGYVELLRKGDVTEEDRKDFLERMEREITRIHRIIRQLLDFSRPSSGKPEMTSVHEIIRTTVNILNPQPMMQEIHVRYELHATRDTVLVDPGRLQQVFLNILMNAADALEAKEISGTPEGRRLVVIRTAGGEHRLEIEFIDNGPGIPGEEMNRIFDPFYTTKEPGKGTGLGLSVSYGIVERVGGSMQAESDPGKGTTIRVSLPLAFPLNGT